MDIIPIVLNYRITLPFLFLAHFLFAQTDTLPAILVKDDLLFNQLTKDIIDPEHIQQSLSYSITDVLNKNANMAINLYIRPDSLVNAEEVCFTTAYQDWQQSSESLNKSMEKLFKELV